ncbi:hypothetical protein [Bartonella elizabethae]|nr:hypothetical protein [Bartonella elizabethae]
MNFNPSDKRFALKRPKTITERLQEAIQQNQRPEYQLPVFPSMISTNNPYNIGSFSPNPIGSISPIEENKSTPIPREEIAPSVENHTSVPAVPITPQEQRPALEPSFGDKLSRFSQSDVSKNIDDFLLGAMTASPDSSGWQLFAKGLKNLHEGDKQRGQVNQTVEYLKSKGYSEEEAAVMARNPQMLSALLKGGDKPTLSPDYQHVYNPETGELEAKVIKGSKAYQEIQQREQLKKLQIVDAKIMRESTAYTINEALEILKKNPKASTGAIGQFLQYLWNTPASRLKNHLEAIRGGVMLHKLERIKALSPNGASGLGNLTDREGKTLESVYGALQQSSSPKDLIKNLQRLQEIYNKATDAQIAILMNDNITAADVDEAFGRSSAQHSIDSPTLTGKYAGVSFITTNEEIQKLPKGSKFAVRTHDGIRIYER